VVLRSRGGGLRRVENFGSALLQPSRTLRVYGGTAAGAQCLRLYERFSSVLVLRIWSCLHHCLLACLRSPMCAGDNSPRHQVRQHPARSQRRGESDRLRVLCSDHRRPVKQKHDGRNTVLDGSRSCLQACFVLLRPFFLLTFLFTYLF